MAHRTLLQGSSSAKVSTRRAAGAPSSPARPAGSRCRPNLPALVTRCGCSAPVNASALGAQAQGSGAFVSTVSAPNGTRRECLTAAALSHASLWPIGAQRAVRAVPQTTRRPARVGIGARLHTRMGGAVEAVAVPLPVVRSATRRTSARGAQSLHARRAARQSRRDRPRCPAAVRRRAARPAELAIPLHQLQRREGENQIGPCRAGRTRARAQPGREGPSKSPHRLDVQTPLDSASTSRESEGGVSPRGDVSAQGTHRPRRFDPCDDISPPP